MAEVIETVGGPNEGTNAGANEPNAGGTSPETGGDQKKTYSQEEFDKALQSETDRRVNKAMETAKAKWQEEMSEKIKSERDEAARLAKMSADERAKAEFEGEKAAFEAERKKYNADKLEFETTKLLAAEGLPVAFAKLLCGSDAESTKANIEGFKTEYAKAIETAVSDRLKSSPPKLPENNGQAADPFLNGFNAV